MNKTIKKRIGKFLEMRIGAEHGPELISYNDLARRFELPPVTDAWFTHPLCSIFESLDEDDARQGRPFRTSVVISERLNRPGEGFFNTLYREGRIKKKPASEVEKMKVYISELNAASALFGG